MRGTKSKWSLIFPVFLVVGNSDGYQVYNQVPLPCFLNGNGHSIYETWIMLVKDDPVSCLGTTTDSDLPLLHLLRAS